LKIYIIKSGPVLSERTSIVSHSLSLSPSQSLSIASCRLTLLSLTLLECRESERVQRERESRVREGESRERESCVDERVWDGELNGHDQEMLPTSNE